jgi:hypothetical protein
MAAYRSTGRDMAKATCTALVVILLSISKSFAQDFAVDKTIEPISERDLLAALSASATVFERYNYEIPTDFCLNVFLQTQVDTEEESESPFGHLCNLAGPYRLMVLWHRNGDDVNVSVHTHRRDQVVGGGSTGTTMTIPNASGSRGYSIDTPILSYGTKTLLADFGYNATVPGKEGDSGQISHTRIKVLVELKKNPHKKQSSGGRHVAH